MSVFRKTTTKLAGLYLGIMMLISLFFSLNIYRLSINEFNHTFKRQGDIIDQTRDNMIPMRIRQIIDAARTEQFNEARDHVIQQLVFTNLVILVGGGVASYYLAKRTLEPIEKNHAALERFTADASHELRTPIAVMQSEIEVALMDPKLSLPEAKERLQSNLEELAKLTALSDGLLKLARLERDDAAVVETTLDSIVDKAITQVLPLAEKKHILLVPQPKLAITIKADPASLTEAVVVLLDNAIKYSPEKTSVKIKGEKTSKHVELHIQDEGLGMTAEEQARIFERFYRADSARSKQKTSGYGLGLAIAKQIVEKHGGTITVSSTKDKGSTFTISLPIETV